MATYRAKADLQLGGAIRIKAGETFSSALVPGRNWHPIDEEATAKVVAAFGEVLPDRPQQFTIGGADSLFTPPRFVAGRR